LKLICKKCFHSELYLEENVTYLYPDIEYREEEDTYKLNADNALHAITTYVLRCAACHSSFPKEVTEDFLGLGGSDTIIESPDLPPIEEEEDVSEELILPSGWSKPS